MIKVRGATHGASDWEPALAPGPGRAVAAGLAYLLLYYRVPTLASAPCLPGVRRRAQALSSSAAVPSCNRISLKTLNCGSQPQLIKACAIPGAFLWPLGPSHTSPVDETPMARIARDLVSVHSVNRCAAVWSPCPQEIKVREGVRRLSWPDRFFCVALYYLAVPKRAQGTECGNGDSAGNVKLPLGREVAKS